jgi:hypothetical protein
MKFEYSGRHARRWLSILGGGLLLFYTIAGKGMFEDSSVTTHGREAQSSSAPPKTVSESQEQKDAFAGLYINGKGYVPDATNIHFYDPPLQDVNFDFKIDKPLDTIDSVILKLNGTDLQLTYSQKDETTVGNGVWRNMRAASASVHRARFDVHYKDGSQSTIYVKLQPKENESRTKN